MRFGAAFIPQDSTLSPPLKAINGFGYRFASGLRRVELQAVRTHSKPVPPYG